MGVYISGMEMPKDYSVIVKIFPDGRVGTILYVQWFKVELIEDTQSVPVPPHGRLIDVDKVLDELAHKLGIRSLDYLTPSERAIVSWFRDAPTIIPADPPPSTHVVTNYDRLIRKTPEELADYCVAGSYCPPGVSCAGKATCNACWLDWLKEPSDTGS